MIILICLQDCAYPNLLNWIDNIAVLILNDKKPD